MEKEVWMIKVHVNEYDNMKARNEAEEMYQHSKRTCTANVPAQQAYQHTKHTSTASLPAQKRISTVKTPTEETYQFLFVFARPSFLLLPHARSFLGSDVPQSKLAQHFVFLCVLACLSVVLPAFIIPVFSLSFKKT